MKVITPIQEMYELVQIARQSRRLVGVVPTMGALHEGHLSLVQAARAECDYVVTTIFVNPTQFAPQEDLDQYPRPIESDLEKLKDLGVDAVFCPTNAEIYPAGFSTYVDPPAIAHPFEGTSRQHHFRGVATIVLKLFQIVPADAAYFGQKDFQQTLVVKKMVEDLNLPIQIKVCPIVRDADGLALSSRNVYLSPEERQRALSLNRILDQIRREILAGAEVPSTLAASQKSLAREVDELEYLALVDASTLEPLDALTGTGVILVAARVGNTRLIDNLLIEQLS